MAVALMSDTTEAQAEEIQAEEVVEEAPEEKTGETPGSMAGAPQTDPELSQTQEVLQDVAPPEDAGDGPEEDWKQAYQELEEEFDDVTDILVDVRFDDDVAEFFLEHKDHILQISKERAGKARFYIHREPNDELYLLLSPKPDEFNASWLSMRNPKIGLQAFEKFGDGLLEVVMEKPTFEDVDWQLDGSGVYAPMGLTKSRLIDTFFFYELVDPQEQNKVAFTENEVEDAATVAKRTVDKKKRKPSL